MQQFNSIEYLQIDIANSYGLDKEDWSTRLDFVFENEHKLEELTSLANSPILYSKAVSAYREAQEGNAIGHMVSLDATASGLQIMSILMRCEKTAKLVNVINTDTREDVYDLVGNKMGVARDVIKKPLMVFFYGGTKAAKELLGDKYDSFIDTLQELMPGAYKAMELMQSTWKPDVTHHTWRAPDGHFAHVPVMGKEKKRINIEKTSFTHIASINKPEESGLSMAANFTHSIDGYIVREMIRKAHAQGYDLVTIHDSFHCHPNHMQKTRENYRSILIELAKKPVMTDWLTQMGFTCTDDSQESIDKFVSKIENMEYMLS